MTDTDTAPDRPALIAPALAPARAPSGAGMACLRGWQRVRDRGGSDAEREAALSGAPSTNLPLNPLDKEQ